MRTGFYLHSILILLIFLSLSISTALPVMSGEEKKSQIYSTLSSDLLQLLDKSYCPAGQSPEDIILGMESNGQIKRDNSGIWSVHVMVELEDGRISIDILPFLTQVAEDTSYHIISGWVTSENLTALGAKDGIRSIIPVFPPAGSGSFEIITNNTTPDSTSGATPDSTSVKTRDREWKTKLSTDLLQLVDDQYLSPGQSRADSMALMEKTGEVRIQGEEVEVRILAKTRDSSPLTKIESFFSETSQDSDYGRIGGWISVSNITRLAMQENIISLMVQIPPRTSEVTTEGDYILETRNLRNQTGISGEGICVGVISDGVDGLEDMIAAGELPSVKVLSDKVGGDEGTAMLQIIHDIAPNATLIFHDRGESQIEYVKALDQLIIHGCRIICDDITYVEPFFEDGYISQNINDRVLSYRILSITAAGNFAEEHYQAPFSGYEDQGYKWQMFNGSKGKDMYFTVPPGISGHVILQWDDRFGASSNNYDLFLYDDSGREIARSVNLQDGDDDPMEWVRFLNHGSSKKEYSIRVVQAAADDALLEIYVLPLSGRSIEVSPNTPEDSVFGQQTVTNALTVGAVAPDLKRLKIQDYSSIGPVTIRYPVPEQRKKPDLVAPDHITVLTGNMQQAVFTGTSAAAPHIAGLAALIWSANPSLREDEIREILINGTTKNETGKKWNPDIGYGLPSGENFCSLDNFSVNSSVSASSVVCTFKPRNYENAENITLNPGWNMISIPYPLEEGNTTGQLFENMSTDTHSIWRYDAEKRLWNPVKPFEQLEQMDVIWVYSPEKLDLIFPFDNSGVNQTFKELHTGWNPAGVPGRESITAGELLSPLSDAWTTILVYDSSTQSFRPSIINGGSGTYSKNRLLYPAEGWWVYMNRPGILFPV
ncbi:S8 family peptidase [Methanospirillum stamsii]|uniref:Peptidase S8/S53 domain-containing protein n=1 Tax=Methanospirillum stamsii TaxID=1277351 RepID=A0A2V2N3Q7_9EURY|nr:S8 family serine peptidase [Methanospirillum stamsii]PWR74782.1 hypothetical protein DLD82_07760 [Methanospirillum stamsii]